MVAPHRQKPPISTEGAFLGWHTIHGQEDGAVVKYMTRIWVGRLRLHIFHRGDRDLDHHDHPWDFWTFPFTSYVEEVAVPIGGALRVKNGAPTYGFPAQFESVPGSTRYSLHRQVVPAWRLSFRPAEHRHRVLGPYSGFAQRLGEHVGIGVFPYDERRVNGVADVEPIAHEGRVVTLVWRSKRKRDWGFLKNRNGQWCWIAWREYVFGGGRDAPCQ